MISCQSRTRVEKTLAAYVPVQKKAKLWSPKKSDRHGIALVYGVFVLTCEHCQSNTAIVHRSLCVMIHDFCLISNVYSPPPPLVDTVVSGRDVVHHENLTRASEVSASHEAALVSEPYF